VQYYIAMQYSHAILLTSAASSGQRIKQMYNSVTNLKIAQTLKGYTVLVTYQDGRTGSFGSRTMTITGAKNMLSQHAKRHGLKVSGDQAA
jgi:hypothetical protein